MNNIEIVDIQDINKDEAKKQIIDYFKTHKTAWISELAEVLRLDIELIIEITDELEKEGKVKENLLIT